MKTDLFKSWGHCQVFQICWHIACSTFTGSSFRIWNSSTGIPSPPLAWFALMLPKAQFTSHSWISCSRHQHGYLGHWDPFYSYSVCITYNFISIQMPVGIIFYFKAKLACYPRYLLTSYFVIPVPFDEKDTFFFWLLVLEGLVGLHRTAQLQLLQHSWLGHRLGLLWYWMVYLGNKQRSFCHFWDCTQELHFRLFHWLWGVLCFF